MIIKAISGPLDAGTGTTTTTTTTSTTTISPSAPITLEGFGKDAAGANTATVYHVTTLTGTGAGSLSYGLGVSGPSPTGKTIVFDVAGTITCADAYQHTVTSGSYFTIDGTTAPYPGIIISNTVFSTSANGLSLEGANVHHVIVKGITFTNCANDGCNVADGAHDIMFTNCFVYNCGDGNLDLAATQGQNFTMQWCIIGNHTSSLGPDNDGCGGTLVTTKFASVHHNLFYPKSPNPNEGERFPFVHCNYSPVANPNCDIRNNIMYQYGRGNATGSGFAAGIGYGAHMNVVNNYFYTISSTAAPDGVDLNADGTSAGSAYSAGNVSGNGINFNATSRYTNASEYIIPAAYQITPESACASRIRVLAQAGITQRNPIGGGRRPDEQAYIDGVTVLTGCA